MRLFHGTTSSVMEAAKTEGLHDPYLTDLPSLAEAFARFRAENDYSNPVVIELDANPEHLYADEIMYKAPHLKAIQDFGGFDKYLELVQRGEIHLPDDDDWEKSLAEVHSVRYQGLIPQASFLRRYRPSRSKVLDDEFEWRGTYGAYSKSLKDAFNSAEGAWPLLAIWGTGIAALGALAIYKEQHP